MKWKKGWVVLVIVLAVVCAFWLLKGGTKHIEDSNGPDDYGLVEVTDQNIIQRDIGAVGGPSEDWDSISNTTTYSADKFTGVAEIYGESMIANRLEITVNHAQVTAGNFRLVLLVDDEIVHDFALNELMQSYVLEDVSGYVSLRIAGESAAFSFDYFIV